MCIVDLFGQAGCLYEAHNIIKNMPVKPNASTWTAVLNACRIHNNLELGEKVAQIIFEMKPSNSTLYKLLADLYAILGRWDDYVNVSLMTLQDCLKHFFEDKQLSHLHSEGAANK
ncbi:hypothetical protein Patl1_33553 [Pistacia atlantica]|uniref:Uncharacterized protein n=1 Tax=Pistacia atlantica TaxID=434234 RepID=A0ACC0ZQX2_9ROSI|nr:hypothetical protein Patl1_33553 [Pistacia atlantica]